MAQKKPAKRKPATTPRKQHVNEPPPDDDAGSDEPTGAAAPPPAEPDPLVNDAPLLYGVRKECPTLENLVSCVVLREKVYNAEKKCIGTRAVQWEGPAGPCEKLEHWRAITLLELAELFGGGTFYASVYCEGKTGQASGFWITLPGAVKARPSNGAQGKQFTSVTTDAGTVLELSIMEGMSKDAQFVYAMSQQALARERERNLDLLESLDKANTRALDIATGAQHATAAAIETVKAALHNIHGLASGEGGSAKSEGGEALDKSMRKLFVQLIDRERDDKKDANKELKKMREEMEAYVKRSKEGKKEAALEWLTVGKEILHDMPATVKEVRELMKQNDTDDEKLAERLAEERAKGYAIAKQEMADRLAALQAQQQQQQAAQQLPQQAASAPAAAEPTTAEEKNAMAAKLDPTTQQRAEHQEQQQAAAPAPAPEGGPA